MILVRTVTEKDLSGVMLLAEKAFPGMTTLPPDQDVLTKKIAVSQCSLAKDVQEAGDETYFFVMEDTESGAIVGTSAVIACLGVDEEFYSYKLNKVTQSCKELDKKITFETLNLSNHFEGYAEVATLFLDQAYRKNGNGKLLARSRYLFMAEFRERFPEGVMSDLRGYFDDHGNSPFWDAVGSHFFDMSFAEADLYGAINGNQFIADLMPKHPLYVNMLPAAAQKVIGQPNVKGKAALEMLKNEGFNWNGHVDIFDAAPSVDVRVDDVRTVSESANAELLGLSEWEGDDMAMIATTQLHDFKVCLSPISIEKGGVRVPRDTLQGLQLELGDRVRYCLV